MKNLHSLKPITAEKKNNVNVIHTTQLKLNFQIDSFAQSQQSTEAQALSFKHESCLTEAIGIIHMLKDELSLDRTGHLDAQIGKQVPYFQPQASTG